MAAATLELGEIRERKAAVVASELAGVVERVLREAGRRAATPDINALTADVRRRLDEELRKAIIGLEARGYRLADAADELRGRLMPLYEAGGFTLPVFAVSNAEAFARLHRLFPETARLIFDRYTDRLKKLIKELPEANAAHASILRDPAIRAKYGEYIEIAGVNVVNADGAVEPLAEALERGARLYEKGGRAVIAGPHFTIEADVVTPEVARAAEILSRLPESDTGAMIELVGRGYRLRAYVDPATAARLLSTVTPGEAQVV